MKISSIDFLHSETSMKLLGVQPKLRMPQSQWHSHWEGQGGRVPLLTAIAKSREKEGENHEKAGKKGKNQEKRGKIGKVLSRCFS